MTAPQPEPQNSAGVIADAPRANWVDRFAPQSIRPFCKLARYDRPIGTWLLLLPCLYAQSLAHLSDGTRFPNIWYMVLFAIGALVMRGAGCTWNDIVDRDFDGRVERTALRPIPSGQVGVRQAIIFAVAQALVGLAVLLQFNSFTIWLAIASLALVAIYPFAKRFTYWPQLVLGMTFNWGALVGFSAVTGGLPLAAIVLYFGSIAWTIGYDTIYAHQDKEDDALLGLKSTALRFGPDTARWLTAFYTAAILLFSLAAYLAGAGTVTGVGLMLITVHLYWQIVTLDINDSANCLVRFKSNRDVGLILTASILVESLFA